MRKLLNASSWLFAVCAVFAMQTAFAADATPAWHADLTEVRQMAGMIPGPRPLRVNVIKVAESRRTKNFAVKGLPAEPSVQARTAYQIVYADGTVMVDTGMDLDTHRFFGRGVEEPYFPEAQARVEKALQKAKAIIVTHEHGDHVGGLIRSGHFAELAPKAVLTRAQLDTLLNAPQIPELKPTTDVTSRLQIIDYNRYMAFAPGTVLIKAPGHTPGSQMVYVTLQSGKELLLAGDVAWHMDAVRLNRPKDAPWIKEPAELMTAELDWLNGLSRSENNLSIVISHDEEQRRAYIEQGVLGDGFE
ncbi:MBL fold metallo-hydrolase [Bradyrhizobium erythrophlei]|jgi:glyoxylase-like metal-dependent hydrolase (beta-lactamase superfamily II)|uniref:Metallo-beta-lactamase superfamily protein n=1 Tax=Bradyrhizobium erythrophlei TaxID=1437360 RepID=A0A1M7UJ56_9BRAD|nr:MBL fold metallo-hydrolase [Bradyrhizobium erythrophlei]SHN82978.1 Metallo-beta-lactamase superfamily protein [Bradyrhizobium erythrophlei]